MTDDEIATFLQIRDFILTETPLTGDGPIGMYAIPLDAEFFRPVTTEDLLEDIEEFLQRGIILRDYETGRFGSARAEVIIGWPKKCAALADLLVRVNEVAVSHD